MYSLTVQHAAPEVYRVQITEAGFTSSHLVWVAEADLKRYGGSTPEDLVLASMRFLLDRESQESILEEFDILMLERFFPEYPVEIQDRLLAPGSLKQVRITEIPPH